jgi:hypothetical protein
MLGENSVNPGGNSDVRRYRSWRLQTGSWRWSDAARVERGVKRGSLLLARHGGHDTVGRRLRRRKTLRGEALLLVVSELEVVQTPGGFRGGDGRAGGVRAGLVSGGECRQAEGCSAGDHQSSDHDRKANPALRPIKIAQ